MLDGEVQRSELPSVCDDARPRGGCKFSQANERQLEPRDDAFQLSEDVQLDVQLDGVDVTGRDDGNQLRDVDQHGEWTQDGRDVVRDGCEAVLDGGLNDDDRVGVQHEVNDVDNEIGGCRVERDDDDRHSIHHDDGKCDPQIPSARVDASNVQMDSRAALLVDKSKMKSQFIAQHSQPLTSKKKIFNQVRFHLLLAQFYYVFNFRRKRRYREAFRFLKKRSRAIRFHNRQLLTFFAPRNASCDLRKERDETEEEIISGA